MFILASKAKDVTKTRRDRKQRGIMGDEVTSTKKFRMAVEAADWCETKAVNHLSHGLILSGNYTTLPDAKLMSKNVTHRTSNERKTAFTISIWLYK